MTPPFRPASVRAVSLLGVLLCVASAQNAAPASLRSRLGLPNAAPAVQPSLRPVLPHAITPLDLPSDGWTLPAVVAVDVPPLQLGTVTTLPAGRVARFGVVELGMSGVHLSRDLRWTRVELRLRNLGAKTAALGGLSWRASGEQGSDLATLPGLYDRSGTPVNSLLPAETRELALWIQLPVEGSGDVALRGGELAATLLIGNGSHTLRLTLPRFR